MNPLEKGKLLRLVQRKIYLEEKLPLVYAGVLANEVLNHFDERVLDGVEQWLEGTLADDFQVDGISLRTLRKRKDISLFGALCILDVYLRDRNAVSEIIWELREDEVL